ncbi:MAG TPA: TIGR03067 domain-containing protein [Gemmataceae bacterium]|nr:TIGR03067 domain-containing protein [Gemmataceae bacterium]
MRCAMLLAVLGPLAGAASVRADEAADKAAKELEGLWLVVRIESDGRVGTGEDVKDMRWRIQGGQILARDPDGKEGKMSFVLDPGKDPKAIDVTSLDGKEKGQTVIGIYDLKEGRLRICLRGWEEAVKGRPTKFSAEKGSGLGMITLERAKEKK